MNYWAAELYYDDDNDNDDNEEELVMRVSIVGRSENETLTFGEKQQHKINACASYVIVVQQTEL